MASFARVPAALIVAAALASASAPGCGPAQSVSNSPEHYDIGSLDEVGDLYLSSYNTKKKPPVSMKDLNKADLFVGGANALRKGEIIVYWGVAPTPEEPSTEILAYKADVPTKGGYVLLKDMTTKTMSAEEFQAAPKPTGPTSADTAKAAPKKGS
ncbi:hypothetical protein [Paludisphaera mucosa]|uniref:Lipoprotein n=1 Tax=Paludisphaera mucosa TaxID=3030827 RepID=A0ABT6FJT0_9BACT|nr:hypothetical protein [Paludisphaera mucosa]MDG3007838.1 hypothetical protein [Paludisphaera mucosa]